jgi:hypothetical protein
MEQHTEFRQNLESNDATVEHYYADHRVITSFHIPIRGVRL